MFSIFPSKVELQALMKYYDTDGDGNISYEEFISGLRDDLTEKRQEYVDRAFGIMDKDGTGTITVADIKDVYDVTQDPRFIEGKLTKEEILVEFLNEFDSARGNDDGVVTKEEWDSYYSDLSMSCPTEEYFVRMMQAAWGLE